MGTKIQLRRGSTADRQVTTFDNGEPGWDTSLKRLFVGDGVTPGGVDIAPPVVSFKNRLINADFTFVQRGISFNLPTDGTTQTYTFDRWVCYNGGNTYNVSQSNVSLDSSDRQSRNACLAAITSVSGAGNFSSLQQRMENVRILAGRTVTVSFTASATVSGKSIGIGFQQNFGNGGSPSSSVNINGQSQLLTQGLARYTKTFSIPSVSGKTLGTNNNDYTELVFWLDAGSNFNARSGSCGQLSASVILMDVQVELGAVATDLELRPLGLELALCQRYFEKSYDPTTSPGTGTQAGYVNTYINANILQATFPVTFCVIKRAIPNIVMYSPATGAAGKARDYQSNVDITANISGPGTRGFGAFLTPSANGIFNMGFQFTADSEL